MEEIALAAPTVDMSLWGLFAQAGWEVQACTARVFEPEATERALLPFLELAPRLGMPPDAMRLHLSAYQWLVEARRR